MSNSLCLIEFVCNLRWVLSYAVQRLDPVLEAHYNNVIKRARQAESDVLRSYSSVKSLMEVSQEALTLAQEGIVYLLVAEGVLGHCPPTLHPFLLRATTSPDSRALSDCTCQSDVSSLFQLQSARSVYQAQFLFIRWLVAEGLLTDEELLDSLGGETDASDCEQKSRFELHVSMAKSLSSGSPFALQAHVILTRSIVLHHCCLILSVDDILAHVRFLDPMCSGTLESIEDALVFWMHHVLKVMHEKKIITDQLYGFAAKELGDSLYHTVQSGVVLGLIVHFYKQDILPLSHICTASGEGEETTGCRERRLQNWGSVLRVSEELGLWPCLYADEVERYGAVVLQLHVLRFVGELFAVLATQAEDLEEHGEDVYCMPLKQTKKDGTTAQSQGTMDFARETKRNDVNLKNCHLEKGDDIITMGKGDEANVVSSQNSSSGYPSAHSRRQYDVMMASLQMRGVDIGVSGPQRSYSSSVKTRGSAGAAKATSGVIVVASTASMGATAAVTSSTSSSSSGTAGYLSRTASRRFIPDNLTLSKNLSNTELVHSHVNSAGGVIKGNVVQARQPTAINPPCLSFVANANAVPTSPISTNSPVATVLAAVAPALSHENFPAPPSMESVVRASNPYDQVSFLGEKDSGKLFPPTSTVNGIHNNMKESASCTTTESSFPINLAGKLGSPPQSKEMETARNLTSSSRSHSNLRGQGDIESEGISPMTPELATDQSDAYSQTALTSFNQQHLSSLRSQSQRRRSEAHRQLERRLRDLLRDLSAVDPSSIPCTAAFHTLLRTLEKQQTIIQRLSSRLEAMNGGNPLSHDDVWSWNEGTSGVSEGPGSTHLLCCEFNCGSDGSGQNAETEISSIPDDFLDDEKAPLDH
ncbi:hypothetical protein MOQ_006388 [Trypanosoma cruzi marinkellei]|uniref:Calponin-homology (CH) domain-containing protein n=1 Tax=Trypanosoma cruzi marinkellei TaxID=85056 RepID=K2NLN5_TRYCR|nr:hypothetical protein MOQ_006388 [Trypanosoma cruzi marinkellei]